MAWNMHGSLTVAGSETVSNQPTPNLNGVSPDQDHVGQLHPSALILPLDQMMNSKLANDGPDLPWIVQCCDAIYQKLTSNLSRLSLACLMMEWTGLVVNSESRMGAADLTTKNLAVVILSLAL